MILLLTPMFAPATQWLAHFKAEMPELEVRIWPDAGDPAEIEVAAVGHPPPGMLRQFPRLRLIASLFAGQEQLLADPTLPPDVPIVRTGDPEGDAMMNEVALLHVLRHHRHLPDFLLAQQRHEWLVRPRLKAEQRKVGVMGLGFIGRATALYLKRHGFQVIGWARRPQQIDGIATFHGWDQLPLFLGQSEILVNLVALTPETENILNRETFAQLPKGAAVINLARGPHVVDEDLIAALDSGHLSGATLDVFRQEPLPKESPLWDHPRITIIPHSSRQISAQVIVGQLCQNLRRLQRGEKLEQLVDRAAGY